MINHLFTGIRWTSFAALVQFCIGLFQTFILVRLLQKSDFAAISLIQVFAGLGLQWQYALFHSGVVQQHNLSPAQLAGMARFSRWGGLVSAIMLGTLSAVLSWQFRVIDLLYLGLVSGFGLIGHAVGGVYKSRLYRDFWYKQLFVSELIAFFFAFIVTIGTAWIGWGPFSLAAGFSTRYLVEGLFYRFYSGRILMVEPAPREEMTSLLRFGRAHLTERLVTQFVFNLDNLLIGRFLGLEALGVYDVFKRTLVRPAALVTEALERAVFPVYSRIQTSEWRLRSVYLGLLNVIGTLHLPVYLVIWILAPGIVRLFFGESWLVFLEVFRWFAVFVVLHALINPVDHLLLALGKIQVWTKASLGYGILLLGLMAWRFEGGLLPVVKGIVGLHLLFWIVSCLITWKTLPGMELKKLFAATGTPFLTTLSAALAPGILWYADLVGPVVFTAIFLLFYLYLAFRFNRTFAWFLKRILVIRQ